MKKKLGIGILCMGAGIFALTLDIDSRFHYFGVGAIFGIGVMMVGLDCLKRAKKFHIANQKPF